MNNTDELSKNKKIGRTAKNGFVCELKKYNDREKNEGIFGW